MSARCLVPPWQSNLELERQGPLCGAELHCGNKSQHQWAHQIYSASLGHIFGIPGWAQNAQSQRSGLAALHCGGSWPPLKLLIWWFDKADEYLFPGWKHPFYWKEVHWWWLNRSLPHHELDVANTSPVVSYFLAWAFVPKLNELIW